MLTPIFLLLIVATAAQGEEHYLYGEEKVSTANGPFSCQVITFKTPFLDDKNVHVQVSFYQAAKDSYIATVGWVERINRLGFRACAVLAETVSGPQDLRLNWLAYDKVPKDAQNGLYIVPLFTTGSVCNEITFDKPFLSSPRVIATIRGSVDLHVDDAASLWVDHVTTTSFRACVRELKNFAGVHTNIEIDWLALASLPQDWKVHGYDEVDMRIKGAPMAAFRYSFCKEIYFAQPFHTPPVLLTTPIFVEASGAKDANKYADRAFTEWIEDVTIFTAKVCLKDMRPLTDTTHIPVRVQYMAIGDLDPCLNVKCKFFATCKAFGPNDGRCICKFNCPEYEDSICSRERVTYDNYCRYKKDMCQRQTEVPIQHAGSCRHFNLQRGRASLNLADREVQCTTVAMDTKKWYKPFGVHVLLTINYDSDNSAIVHDAITTWVEGASQKEFRACALRAGRGDPQEGSGIGSNDVGKVTVDWAAFQGSPRGGVAGEMNISNWWDGTTCKRVALPKNKFSSAPSILVTSRHTIAKMKHDAATVWTEDVTSRSFKICLRELQDFDGLHKDIRVVWLAYENLPKHHFSEHNALLFSPSNPSLYIQNNAFCKRVKLTKIPLKMPTVLLSASHSGKDKVPPGHNSIASWVESGTKSSFLVCMKELQDQGHYDPVTISWAVLPDCDIPLGMQSRAIKDQTIKASTSLPTTPPQMARLHSSKGAWCPAKNADQWLQIDLGHVHSISGVATQGSRAQKMWTKMFRMAFSNNGKQWTDYHENFKISKQLAGNTNGDSVKTNMFGTDVDARYVRFLPITWHGKPCMRTEIYGCDTEPVHVKLVSMGFDDVTPDNGPIEASIVVDGIERSLKKRGHNLVSLKSNGDFISARSFDTFAVPSSGSKMAEYIRDLPNETIVLVAVQGHGNNYVAEAASALRSLGAKDPTMPGLKGSWVFIGYKTVGREPDCVKQKNSPDGKGPTTLIASIPAYA